jgi:hypothetical protein
MPKGVYKRTHSAWNKGMKGYKHKGSFKSGVGSKLYILPKGEKHYLWKGNKASYSSIHKWITKNYGKAVLCEECGSDRFVEWANISKKYKRNRVDFKQLCKKCHWTFDRNDRLDKLKRNRLRKLEK